MTPVFRYDRTGVLDSDRVQTTPQGGLRIPARFTRIGVLEYELPDGTKRREYRPPDEVFRPESMATLVEAPVTHLHPPTGKVDASTYSVFSKGHVSSDVGPENDRYLAGTAVVQDADTVRRVGERELVEISAGYTSKLDMTPGITPEGEPYDCIQRDIKYNHVALLPRGEGRAGPEVSLRLDSNGHQVAPDKETNMELTPEELAALKALAAVAPKLIAAAEKNGNGNGNGGVDGSGSGNGDPRSDNDETPKNDEGGDEPKKDQDDQDDQDDPGSPDKEPRADESDGMSLTPEEIAKLKALAAGKLGEPKADEGSPDRKEDEGDEPKSPEEIAREQERIINDSIELRDKARRVIGPNYVFTGKSNRQVTIDVIRHVDSKFSPAGKSDEALAAVLEMAIARHVERADSKKELEKVRQTTTALRTDSAEPELSGVAAYLTKNIQQAGSRKAG